MLKGIPYWGTHKAGILPIEDVSVERCVIWTDWGRSLEIGAETATPYMRRIIFRDCDLIHTSIAAIDIQHGDNAMIEDILYEDIRVEMDGEQLRPQFQQNRDDAYIANTSGPYLPELFFIGIAQNLWSTAKQLGSVTNVRYKNIHAIAPRPPGSNFYGADAGHTVRDIQFDSVFINGKAATSLAELGIVVGPFVSNVRITNSVRPAQ